MKRKITIKELSKNLNLSVSTVSKSLSDSHEISESTKKRVRRLAKQCNYRPNNFASAFRLGKTKTIGVIIPNILNPFFAKVLIGIEKETALQGYKIITSISYESALKESHSIELMASGYVDGLILCIAKETQLKNKFKPFYDIIDQGLPMVLFDRVNHLISCDKVINDDFQISYKATEYLIKKCNCKKIAIVSLIDDLPYGRLRADGFRLAMKDNNIEYEDSFIMKSTDVNKFNTKIRQYLKKKKVNGIFGVNEAAIINLIHSARSLGYSISKDLSIAAFCNQSQMAYNPSLMEIDQHAEKIGEKTAYMLLERIKKTRKRKYKTAIIKASLSIK